MSRRERIVQYVRETIDPEFDPQNQPLLELLDSVSLMQLVMFIDQELRVPLELSQLSLEMFTTVETIVQELEATRPES